MYLNYHSQGKPQCATARMSYLLISSIVPLSSLLHPEILLLFTFKCILISSECDHIWK